jgi:hypothetical protein
MDRDNSYMDLADFTSSSWLTAGVAKYEPIAYGIRGPPAVHLPPLEIPTRKTSPHQQ